VRNPGQSPLAHARIIASRVSDLLVPEPLGLALAALTDGKGRAFVSGILPDEIRLEAPGFGVQTIAIPDSKIPDSKIPGDTNRTITVTLAHVGRVVGCLVAAQNEPIKGMMVRATTQVGGYVGSGQGGSAKVSCDAHGRFEIPAIAAGPCTRMLVFDRENSTPLRGEPPQKVLVRADQTTQVTIPLRPTIQVRGQYREQGTKQPIAGVKILLNGQFGGDRYAITSTDGTFTGWISRDVNQPFVWPLRIPAPYYQPSDMALGVQRMPAAGSNELVLPPAELPRGIDVKGSVVNEQGKPVTGAEIMASWEVTKAVIHSILARTDQGGHFTLCGVDPIAELKLTTWDGFASTAAEMTIGAKAVETEPIVLRIDPKNTMPVGGRIVDLAGDPVPGASVQLWCRARGRNGREMVIEPIMLGDPFRSIRTDSQGRYRAPRRLPLGGEYYARAIAPGRLAAFSPAVNATDVDPSAVLEWLGTVKFNNADRLSAVKFKLVEALSHDSLDEATALIEASTHVTLRAQGYAGICEVRRDLDPGRVKELLTHATVNA
jgi:protocatechuate 3,4-dioxygenase beta subunit